MILSSTHSYIDWSPIRHRGMVYEKKRSFQLIFPAPIVIKSQIFMQWSFASQSVSMLKTYAIKSFLFSKIRSHSVFLFFLFYFVYILPFRCISILWHFIVLIILSTIWCVYTHLYIQVSSIILCQRNCFNDTGKHLFKCLYFLLLLFRFSAYVGCCSFGDMLCNVYQIHSYPTMDFEWENIRNDRVLYGITPNGSPAKTLYSWSTSDYII